MNPTIGVVFRNKKRKLRSWRPDHQDCVEKSK